MADSRNELSMDEILSSIKKIIADEDQVRPVAAKKPAKSAATAKPDRVQAEVAVTDEILELTNPAEEGDETSVLLDEDTAQNLARRFSTLQTLAEPGAAPQVVRSGETSLEEMARGLLKPMLKDWLDSNLPNIVESMVEREIARITKKG